MSEQPKIQQAITLVKTYVKSLNLDCDSLDFDCTNDLIFTLDTEIYTNNANENLFVVEFQLVFQNQEGNDKFDLEVNFRTLFKTKDKITKDFMSSFFVQANAPAIAFPFLRSFVTTIVSNAGYSPIIISSINFAAEFEKNQRKIS